MYICVQGDNAEQAARAAAAADKELPRTSAFDDTMPSPPQPATPYDSSPKLESSELGRRRRTGLNMEQRRSHANSPRVKGASCDVGVDGGSIVEDQKVEDYEDYYKDHRPSPISEIEVADTRKPITKATSGGAYEGGGEGGEWAGWSEEQLDTAEEALRRAEAIFRERAAKGIPEWPHSNALRRLIGHHQL